MDLLPKIRCGPTSCPTSSCIPTSDRRSSEFVERLDREGHDLLAPVGYGLVVVDHLSKTVHSMQNYCETDCVSVSQVNLDMEDEERAAELRSIADAGRFRLVRWLPEGDALWSDLHVVSWDEITGMFGDFRGSKLRFDSGWSHVSYRDADCLDFMARLVSDGFVVSERERDGWFDWSNTLKR